MHNQQHTSNLGEIVSIDIASVARVLAVVSAITGFIICIFTAFAMDLMTEGEANTLMPAVLLVVFWAISGFVGGCVYAVVYNLGAAFGGLEVEVE